MRRIKSVAVSVPSVVGPYTNINCTLALQHSTVRTQSILKAGKYVRETTTDDSRFVDYYGAVQTIVTSSGTADSGLFETNLRDDRFLPFEGAGAISTWTLSLPEIASFDYSTVTDVILQIRYTARDGGSALAGPALAQIHQMPPVPSAGPAPSLALLLSLRHDFPTQWYAFATGTQPFSATLTTDYFPYSVQNTHITLNSVTLFSPTPGSVDGHTPVTPDAAALATMSQQLHNSRSTTLSLPDDASVLTRDSAKEVYAVITYTAVRT